MTSLTLTSLFTACIMAGVPGATAAEGVTPELRQCHQSVESACEASPDAACIETGRAACALLHGDPYQTRADDSANLRLRVFEIDGPAPRSRPRILEWADDEASSIMIVNPKAQ